MNGLIVYSILRDYSSLSGTKGNSLIASLMIALRSGMSPADEMVGSEEAAYFHTSVDLFSKSLLPIWMSR